jgi:hypothetical protein
MREKEEEVKQSVAVSSRQQRRLDRRRSDRHGREAVGEMVAASDRAVRAGPYRTRAAPPKPANQGAASDDKVADR